MGLRQIALTDNSPFHDSPLAEGGNSNAGYPADLAIGLDEMLALPCGVSPRLGCTPDSDLAGHEDFLYLPFRSSKTVLGDVNRELLEQSGGGEVDVFVVLNGITRTFPLIEVAIFTEASRVLMAIPG